MLLVWLTAASALGRQNGQLEPTCISFNPSAKIAVAWASAFHRFFHRDAGFRVKCGGNQRVPVSVVPSSPL
jgi:hypothetical protein